MGVSYNCWYYIIENLRIQRRLRVAGGPLLVQVGADIAPVDVGVLDVLPPLVHHVLDVVERHLVGVFHAVSDLFKVVDDLFVRDGVSVAVGVARYGGKERPRPGDVGKLRLGHRPPQQHHGDIVVEQAVRPAQVEKYQGNQRDIDGEELERHHHEPDPDGDEAAAHLVGGIDASDGKDGVEGARVVVGEPEEHGEQQPEHDAEHAQRQVEHVAEYCGNVHGQGTTIKGERRNRYRDTWRVSMAAAACCAFR